MREVTIVSYIDNNNIVAGYNGKRYTAVFNVFVGSFCEDDIYGEVA